jgi:murein L,D-transpeptidase YcbB/YkuD
MHKTTVTDNCGTHLSDSGKTNHLLNFHKRSFRYFLVVLPFALILLISTSYQQNFNESKYLEQEYYTPEVIDSLNNFISALHENIVVKDTERILNRDLLQSFYGKNGFRPAWIHFGGLTERASHLVYMIEHARDYGLEPENYHMASIKKLQLESEVRSHEKSYLDFNLEVLLTDAAMRMMINLHAGYIPLDSALFASSWVGTLPDVLFNGIATGKVIENITSVEPVFIEYVRLREANEKFIRTQSITDREARISYPTRDSVALMSEIAHALTDIGFLKNSGDVIGALKQFQLYHGLTPDGKPGANTIDALRKSTLYKYRMLALNLDRLRKKHYSDSALLYVNIPAFRLKILEGNLVKDTFRVIVGNPASPTPILSGRMQRIIANPMWYVPRSITMNEILPKIKSDSNYLARNNFRLLDKNNNLVNAQDINLSQISDKDFDYTVRQNRGSDNSLGQVKFIFSNPYAVYLHDTPGKALFSKDLRAFSHGCVRVQQPERLANYILREINSDTTDFAQLMQKGQHREFNISEPLSIHITYITCEADDSGSVFFYKDIYGIDKKELDDLSTYMGI